MLPAPVDDDGEFLAEPPPPPPPPKPYPGFWQAIGLYLVYDLIIAGVMLPFLISDRAFHLDIAKHPAVLGVAVLVAAAGVLWIARRRLFLGFRQIAGPVAIPREMLLPMGAAVIGLIAVSLILTLCIVQRFPSLLPDRDLGLDRSLWGGFLLAVIAAPLSEELLFRGIFLRGFLARYGTTRGILLSAVLFGTAHFSTAKLLGTMMAGLMFGWWYLRLGSIWPGVFGHALNNTIPVVMTWLPTGSGDKDALPPFGWWEPVAALVAAILLWYGVYALRRIFAKREASGRSALLVAQGLAGAGGG